MFGEWRVGEGYRYQFAATIGLLLMLRRLDLGFWVARGREDLFFFFWRGRVILVKMFFQSHFWTRIGKESLLFLSNNSRAALEQIEL